MYPGNYTDLPGQVFMENGPMRTQFDEFSSYFHESATPDPRPLGRIHFGYLLLMECSILVQKSLFCFKCMGFETFDYVDRVRTAILPWTEKNASSRARFWTRFVKKWFPTWVLGPWVHERCHPNLFWILALTNSGSDVLASRIGLGCHIPRCLSELEIQKKIGLPKLDYGESVQFSVKSA